MHNVVNSAERRGREEGRKDAKHEAARKMKAKGYPIAEIAEITGLSPEEIENLGEH